MNSFYKISILALLVAFSSCTKSEKAKQREKEEVIKTLSGANDWFKSKKREWTGNYSIRDSLKVKGSRDHKWFLIINQWVASSGHFSKKFIKTQKKMSSSPKFEHFGLMFFGHGLGDMLHSLCDPEGLDTHIIKEGDDKYRYTAPFYKVLNDVPIPDQVEGFLWLRDKGENGEVWLFSIVLIKENDKWVIDEIDRYFRYFEPGASSKNTGVNEQNKLYINNEDYKIKSKKFNLSQIRINNEE